MSIVIAVIVFCIIIVIHELGHFTAARIFKMRVYEFALGMGPTIIKKRGKDTVYSLKAIPFGGFVQLGEDDEATADDPHAFRNKPVWQRMIVILAGVFMNIVLGFLVCLIAVLVSNNIITTTVHGFREGASTNSALQENDKIVGINGMSVLTVSDLSYQLYNTSSKMTNNENTAVFDFTVIRRGKKININNVTFKAENNKDGGKSIVVDFYVYSQEKTFSSVISESFRQTISRSRLIILTLSDIIKGTYGINDFAGPVGVVSEIGKASAMGMEELMTLIALITLNVGIFNLVPIPGLDGARFLFFVIEAVRRKPVKPEIEGMIHFAGFAVLMLFMVVITFNDIKRLIFGS